MSVSCAANMRFVSANAGQARGIKKRSLLPVYIHPYRKKDILQSTIDS